MSEERVDQGSGEGQGAKDFTGTPMPELVAQFIRAANEIRWRLSDTPNPLFENQSGECRHTEAFGCSWRCERKTGAPTPTPIELQQYVLQAVGLSGFCYLTGYGEDATTIDPARLVVSLEAALRLKAFR